MTVTPEQIAEWIEQDLANSKAAVKGDGRHFLATVVCADFAGKSVMQRHRMVYDALGERVGTTIHALSLKTHTPEEQTQRGEL